MLWGDGHTGVSCDSFWLSAVGTAACCSHHVNALPSSYRQGALTAHAHMAMCMYVRMKRQHVSVSCSDPVAHASVEHHRKVLSSSQDVTSTWERHSQAVFF